MCGYVQCWARDIQHRYKERQLPLVLRQNTPYLHPHRPWWSMEKELFLQDPGRLADLELELAGENSCNQLRSRWFQLENCFLWLVRSPHISICWKCILCSVRRICWRRYMLRHFLQSHLTVDWGKLLAATPFCSLFFGEWPCTHTGLGGKFLCLGISPGPSIDEPVLSAGKQLKGPDSLLLSRQRVKVRRRAINQ